jgi:hypothetical protein
MALGAATATPPEGAYVPGVCNIGPAEIARRRRGAWTATFVTLALYIVLVAAGVPPPVRLLVGLPAASAAVSWLQVRERFCVAFGSAGLSNLGPLGGARPVADAAARRADRRKAASMVVRGCLIGAAVGFVAVLVL